MKPDWSKAPKWAQWWAMEDNGDGYWFEKKPYKDTYFETWVSHGKSKIDKSKWINSPQQRPETAQHKGESVTRSVLSFINPNIPFDDPEAMKAMGLPSTKEEILAYIRDVLKIEQLDQ